VIGDGRVRLTVCREGAVRRYLWLKAVTGIDLDTHCAQSLVGRYLDIDRRAWEQDLVLPGADGTGGIKAWYFCGVSEPHVWAHNDHALIVPDPGNADELYTPGYVLAVENARFVAPGISAVPAFARHAEKVRYATCRNWQAAHWLHRFADVPDGRRPRAS
jgi:hypothetical protein